MANNEPKQILIWRNDLRNINGQKCRTGKIAAQLAHASMAAFLNQGKLYQPEQSDDTMFNVELTGALKEWITGRFTKICVSVDNEQELVDIINTAESAGLITSLITDAGLTEFGGVATVTCGAIGPGYPCDIDPITGHLKLL